ncbi:MAG TPA: ABC transporter ATP-binding protein [Bacteroidota bacterium]
MKKLHRTAARRQPPETREPQVTVVRVDKISYSYKNRLALADFSLDAYEGEILGILGPNGSGKSTLFRILSTLLLPATGAVDIGGIDVLSRPQDARRLIGVVFQSAGLDGKLTVFENLRYQGYFYGMKGEFLDSRIEYLLNTLGLTDRRNSRVEVLSGGLQRRAELAKGLLHQPRVLLLDEPSTGLDPAARRDFWTHLRESRKKTRMTVLLTTHLLDEAEGCDRVAIVDRGRLVVSGRPADLRSSIGGDILVIRSKDAEKLQRNIRRAFGLTSSLVDGEVRMEMKEGARMISRIAQAFPQLVEELTMRKPTLEDVFLHKTGHRLERPLTGNNG